MYLLGKFVTVSRSKPVYCRELTPPQSSSLSTCIPVLPFASRLLVSHGSASQSRRRRAVPDSRSPPVTSYERRFTSNRLESDTAHAAWASTAALPIYDLKSSVRMAEAFTPRWPTGTWRCRQSPDRGAGVWTALYPAHAAVGHPGPVFRIARRRSRRPFGGLYWASKWPQQQSVFLEVFLRPCCSGQNIAAFFVKCRGREAGELDVHCMAYRRLATVII